MKSLDYFRTSFNYYKINYLALIFVVKWLVLGLFSSGYQQDLFYPFTNWFVVHIDNPWSAVYNGTLLADFPYSTTMLYVLSIFNYVIDKINIDVYFINNLIYSTPLILSDLLIAYCLVELTQYKKSRVALLYVLSPIVLFSTYIHNQLDVIPISILLLSLVFFVKGKYLRASIIFGLSLGAKLNVLLALPLLMIYMYKHRDLGWVFLFPAISFTTFFISALPFIASDSYIELVLLSSKQKLLFDSKYSIGTIELYLPILASLVLYAYFLSFKKVNKDLLIAFISLLFIANIFFFIPSPGWYVWLLPFVTLSIAKNSSKLLEGYFALGVLNILYLTYFIFAHKYDQTPILFLGEVVPLYKVDQDIVSNVIFTCLESALVCTALYVYKFSVKSNNLYRRKTPFIIGVGGDSGTGKSTLKVLIGDLFKDNLLQIEGDGDHRWERGHENWNNHTHLDPKANWLHRQSENLVELKSWKNAKRVDYDHKTGTFTEQYSIKPKEFILMSGLHPFYLPISRKVVDLKVYMEPNEDLRRYWKVQRDMAHRGYTLEKIMSQIESRVNDAEKYIYPQKQFSDLIISFFPISEISDYSQTGDIEIGLRITCEASIQLEEILRGLNVQSSWDYAEDLSSQIIELYEPPEMADFSQLSNKFIPNIDELVNEPEFDTGYNGFIQLVTLLSISQRMKGENQI